MGLVFERQLHSDQQRGTENMAQKKDLKTTPLLDFVFPESTYDTLDNGLNFNQIYVPEEVLILIFSHIPARDILKLALVCKRWHNTIKMHILWSTIYFNKYRKIPKPLPWYTFYALFSSKYFDGNLLKNNCGQKKFSHWIIVKNGGNKFKIENNSNGCDPYPTDCPDFGREKTCFVTSYGLCHKVQNIPIQSNLIKYIIDKHKPHIYASDWVAGRFDCGGVYDLVVKLYSSSLNIQSIKKEDEDFDFEYNNEEDESQSPDDGILMMKIERFQFGGNEATQWKKVEIILKDYPDGLQGILFEHKGVDNQFWRGHYGPKMAGGVVRLLFDTMEPEVERTPTEEIDDPMN